MPLQGTPSGQRQKRNRGDTLITLLKVPSNVVGARERSITVPPPSFSCLTSVQLFVQLYLFTKYERKTHQKKNKQTNKQRPTATSHVCPPCHGPTKTTKVWVRTKILLTRRWLWSRDQKYPQWPWWPTSVTAKPKPSWQKQKHYGETKNLTAKTKYLTAKPKTSRQKQNTSRQNQKPHGKNKIPHGKTKSLTAKTKYLTAKTKTSRQNQKPHGKTKYFTAKAK